VDSYLSYVCNGLAKGDLTGEDIQLAFIRGVWLGGFCSFVPFIR
jgi:hypothetical protein